jgi:hypothetical protein
VVVLEEESAGSFYLILKAKEKERDTKPHKMSVTPFFLYKNKYIRKLNGFISREVCLYSLEAREN